MNLGVWLLAVIVLTQRSEMDLWAHRKINCLLSSKCFEIGDIGVDRLGGLVVRVLGYRYGGPGSIPGTTRNEKIVGLERGPLSLVITTEELLDRKVATPV
jgi:hypothetical protein